MADQPPAYDLLQTSQKETEREKAGPNEQAELEVPQRGEGQSFVET
jgi:hypothetical protein